MSDDPQLSVKTGSDELDSVITRYNNRPNECTIFRSDVPEEEVLTYWITAKEGSYVHLSMCR
jgi:hypothetical protein